MAMSRRKFLHSAALAGLVFTLPRQALADGADGWINSDGEKVAIGGYDTVAYFTEGKAVRGSPDFESVWRGARWRFASAEHRDMFAREPVTFAPRFGGYCVMAMRYGIPARIDPEAWAIVDGKLYLNSDKVALGAFQKETAGSIQKAEKQWERIVTRGSLYPRPAAGCY